MKGVALFLVLTIPVWAEDWTVNGKTYQNVTVTGSNDSTVSIMYNGGIGRVNLSDLPPDLQKRFNYDPNKARAAEKAEAARLAALDAQHVLDVQKQAAAEAGEQIVPVVPTTPQTLSPGSTGLSPEQRTSIQEQITSLQQDVDFMKKDQAKSLNLGKKEICNGVVYTEGVYAKKIKDEEAQIRQLQAELR